MNRRGFSLAEMMISMAIIAILFISLSSFITRFLQSRMDASEFVDVQDETYIHVQMIESLVKSAKNVFSMPDFSTEPQGSHIYDNLLIQNNRYSDAPFTLIKALKKTVDASPDSYQHLDKLRAANLGISSEYYMAVSSVYLWSGVAAFDEAGLGKTIIYPDPSSGKIKIFDVTQEKNDSMPYAQAVDFGDTGDFVMPTGIEFKTQNSEEKTYFVSDRSNHTVWEITIPTTCNGNNVQLCHGTRTKILGQSGVAGALSCESRPNCDHILLNQPNGLLYRNSVLYIADSGNNRVLSWDETKQELKELIKTESYETGKSPNEIPADKFYMNTPIDLALDSDSVLYVSDSFNHRVVYLSLASGSDNLVHVLAGTGEKGFSGDFGQANLARMNFPTGLSYHVTQAVGTVAESKDLYVSDSGNNLIRRVSFVSYTDTNSQPQIAKIIAPYIGNSNIAIIPQDFVSTVLSHYSDKPSEFLPSLGQKLVSQTKPKSSSKEVDKLLNGNYIVSRLPDFTGASFNFNTGLFMNEKGDAIIVDSLNNQIKMAPVSTEMFTGQLPKANLTNSLNLSTDKMKNRLFPIVRQEDYGNYRFDRHVFSGEKDYISRYPLKYMFFKVSGVSDKIVLCNISIDGLKSGELSSNNFQFSLGLRNPVDDEM